MLKKSNTKSKGVDVFSLGCTFYYLYSRGNHPFGEMYSLFFKAYTSYRHERETNILNNKYKIEHVDDAELEHLIKCMIKPNPEDRYTIEDVIKHPYFWEDSRKIGFIQEVSDFVESTGTKIRVKSM